VYSTFDISGISVSDYITSSVNMWKRAALDRRWEKVKRKNRVNFPRY